MGFGARRQGPGWQGGPRRSLAEAGHSEQLLPVCLECPHVSTEDHMSGETLGHRQIGRAGHLAARNGDRSPTRCCSVPSSWPFKSAYSPAHFLICKPQMIRMPLYLQETSWLLTHCFVLVQALWMTMNCCRQRANGMIQ